jgi:putative intracellular protease/amidase
MGSLKGKKVAILATDGFEQVELTEPRKALDEAGAKTVVIAPKSGQIKAWKSKEWGESVKVDQELEAANPNEFDALVLPGGVMNPDHLRHGSEGGQLRSTIRFDWQAGCSHLSRSMDTTRGGSAERQDRHVVAIAEN